MSSQGPTSSQFGGDWTPRRFFFVAFVLILAAKWQVIDQPPVWDGSKSVFPAAITLAHHDFDVAHLLRQPSYFDGGPNTHGTSLVTWLTAAAYWGLGDRPGVILPLLHLLHFLMAAAALTLLWRIARRAMEPLFALGTVAAVAVFPMFFVQAGYLYLEIPILAFTAAALDAWQRGRSGQAALWATGSILVKPSGAVVAGALVLCALAGPGRPLQRVLTATRLAAGPLAVASLQFVLRPSVSRRSYGSLEGSLAYLKSVPDLAVILVLFTLGTLALSPWRSAVHFGDANKATPDEANPAGATPTDAEESRTHLVSLSMLVAFFGFYLALVPLGISVFLLPRYYLQLFPFVLIGLVAMVVVRSRRLAAGLLFVLIFFFLTNREGHLYPERGTTNFAITERSMAYLDLVQLQNVGLEQLLEAATDVPVFYGLPESFRLDFPQMGFDVSQPARGHCIYNERPYMWGRLQDFPPSFAMLFDYPWLGGEVARDVLQQAAEHPDYETRVAALNVGPFESYLAFVRRKDAAWPRLAQPDAEMLR